MSLENLVGISLEKITPDSGVIERLMSAAERNITDASITAISTENRFDAAYKAIMQLASAALNANGYRTLTSKPGHHMTTLQSLSKTIGIKQETAIILDALRKQRNVADYSGDLVPVSAVEECLRQATILQQAVLEWLSHNHP